MVNVEDVCPASTVTLAGIVALALPLVRFTVVSLGAAPVNVTVPVELLPPMMLVGDTVIEERVGGTLVVSKKTPLTTAFVDPVFVILICTWPVIVHTRYFPLLNELTD